MPMASQAQRGYLHANLPDVAKKFEAETPKGKHLPMHKKKGKKGHQLDAMKKMVAAKKK